MERDGYLGDWCIKNLKTGSFCVIVTYAQVVNIQKTLKKTTVHSKFVNRTKRNRFYDENDL